MTLNSEELLPCPFCGERLHLTEGAVRWWKHPVTFPPEVTCPSMSMVLIEEWPERDEAAIAAWNRRSLPPVDGLEVVAELNRIIAEEAADFADAAGHAIEAGERPDLWDREVEVAVHTLSQASSVIAGLTAERDEAVERGQNWFNVSQDRMERISSLEEENKRLVEADSKRLAHIQKLERRIRNQRRANRDNWQIVEARGNWLGSPRSRAQLVRLMGTNREASNRVFALEGQNKVLQRKLDLLETTLSFTRRWAIEKDGNGTSAEERLSAIANHPGVKGFPMEDHNG